MKKIIICGFFFFIMMIPPVFGQHKVNDIRSYNGWYKISIETDFDENCQYLITQCYPNGDEYILNDYERRMLPLWVKIFCIGMHEEVFKEQADNMSFREDGFFMRILGFTLIIDASMSDEEVLDSLGQEMIDKYIYMDW